MNGKECCHGYRQAMYTENHESLQVSYSAAHCSPIVNTWMKSCHVGVYNSLVWLKY